MSVPSYPEFAPIDMSMCKDLHPALNMTKDGISEFTFANLYLFRRTYNYRVARLPAGNFVIEGEKDGKHFFSVPCGFPDPEIFDDLAESHCYMKNMAESQCVEYRIELENRGYIVTEDRDNFDYLYNRIDLAELTGRDYHKKRNQVNGFTNLYTGERRPLRKDTVPDAIEVLDAWKAMRGIEGDYKAACEGLAHFKELGMRGAVYYINNKPVAWCMGEPVAKGRIFAIHFEKAIDTYKGVYQYINQDFAQSLPAYFKLINREQDLGNEGMRQAKMTYRPVGFVKKYRVTKGRENCRDTGFAEPSADGPGTAHGC